MFLVLVGSFPTLLSTQPAALNTLRACSFTSDDFWFPFQRGLCSARTCQTGRRQNGCAKQSRGETVNPALNMKTQTRAQQWSWAKLWINSNTVHSLKYYYSTDTLRGFSPSVRTFPSEQKVTHKVILCFKTFRFSQLLKSDSLWDQLKHYSPCYAQE